IINRFEKELYRIKKDLSLNIDWEKINLNIILSEFFPSSFYYVPTNEIIISSKCDTSDFASALVSYEIFMRVCKPIQEELEELTSSIRNKIRENIIEIDEKSREKLKKMREYLEAKRLELEEKIGEEKIKEIGELISQNIFFLSLFPQFLIQIAQIYGISNIKNFVLWFHYSILKEKIEYLLSQNSYLILDDVLKHKEEMKKYLHYYYPSVSISIYKEDKKDKYSCFLFCNEIKGFIIIKDGEQIMKGPLCFHAEPIVLAYGENSLSKEEKDLLTLAAFSPLVISGRIKPKTKLIKNLTEYIVNSLLFSKSAISIDLIFQKIIKIHFLGGDLTSKEIEKLLNEDLLSLCEKEKINSTDILRSLKLTLDYIKREVKEGKEQKDVLSELLEGKYLKLLYDNGLIKKLPTHLI
ncbi:MAG: hypothetical protein QXQ19_01910, partial [Candidatus Aenigmatarchaeota archaeon]